MSEELEKKPCGPSATPGEETVACPEPPRPLDDEILRAVTGGMWPIAASSSRMGK